MDQIKQTCEPFFRDYALHYTLFISHYARNITITIYVITPENRPIKNFAPISSRVKTSLSRHKSYYRRNLDRNFLLRKVTDEPRKLTFLDGQYHISIIVPHALPSISRMIHTGQRHVPKLALVSLKYDELCILSLIKSTCIMDLSCIFLSLISQTY